MTAPWVGLRAGVFAGLTVLLGLGAHVLAHGMRPSAVSVAAALGVSYAAAVPLARRERGLPSLLVGVAATQLALHVVFLMRHEPLGLPSAAGLPMLAGHLAAGLSLSLWLRHGERRIWALARGFARRLFLRPVTVPAVALPELPAAQLLSSRVWAHRPPSRGPPAVPVVALH